MIFIDDSQRVVLPKNGDSIITIAIAQLPLGVLDCMQATINSSPLTQLIKPNTNALKRSFSYKGAAA